jgi:pilus assembly protein CpaE
VLSPKGGVGKTACAFALGNVLATHVNQRVVIVDAVPEFGTLPLLVPDALRSERTSLDLLIDAKQISSAAAIRPYMSCLPSGAHVLAAAHDPEIASAMVAEHYEALVALLLVFYEIVILDLGTGLATGLARFATRAADQLVLVTTPDALTAATVLRSLDRLPAERTTVALNMAQPATAWDQHPIEQQFRDQRLHNTATIPFDERLLDALDNQTYDLHALDAHTRVGIMRLAVMVANRLA